ncbi:MAG TPA: LLM class F420-dependent oxidoreductase [Candidatus Dormibacteraeota bacterium]|nr:LLM class F420-dependent oxidoreductase [Candidatus Dormibacteraeota bacterium]
MPLFFGYHMPNFSFPGIAPEERFERVVELACAAEAAGFDAVTLMDHFYQLGGVGPEDEPMFEAYTTLGALAARTTRVRLATLVTGVTYRNPALLAKTVTTLDVISRGRAILGIGAAWHEAEHAGYGFDFPPIGERMDRLDEALTICRAMFTQERPSFAGRHYRIDRALNSPRPIQPGGPKIMVGGGGERRTLRIAARHADLSHWWVSLDELKHKTEVLERHCEAEGRDVATIVRTIGAPVVLVEDERQRQAILDRIPPARRSMIRPATLDEAAEALRPFIDAGAGGFTFSNQTMPTAEAIALGGELIRLLR